MTEAAHEPHQSIIYGTALNRSSRPAWLKATAASGTRLGPFSQGRISKKIPLGLALTPHAHTVDAASSDGAWPRGERAQLLALRASARG